MNKVEKPWGWYQIIYKDYNYWTKILCINPGESLSLQYHNDRTEYWFPLDPGLTGTINGSIVSLRVGVRYEVPTQILHRISNGTGVPGKVIEVATGLPNENDIVRIHDKYSR